MTATTSVSKNGVGFSTVKPFAASSFFASAYVAFAVFADDVWWKTSCTITPVYSGYKLILPLVSDVWISSVEPMFSLYLTVKPFASSACL